MADDYRLGDHFWLSLVGNQQLQMFIDGWVQRFESVGADFNAQADLQSQFISELTNQAWWQGTTATYRDALEMELTDKGSFDENIRVNEKDLNIMATQLGYQLSNDDLNNLAKMTLYKGLTAAEMEREILDVVYYSGFSDGNTQELSTGSITAEQKRIKALASANLISVSDDWVNRQAHNILSEKISSEQVDQMLYDMVSNQYSFIDPDKSNGWLATSTTVSDTLAPLLETVQGAWEDTNVSMNDDWMKEHVVVREEDGTERFATVTEMKQMAYQDERHQGTSIHRQNMDNFAGGLLQMFGVRG
jgi:hypothetical protein